MIISGFAQPFNGGAFTDLQYFSRLFLGDRLVGMTAHWEDGLGSGAFVETLALFFQRDPDNDVPALPDNVAKWPGGDLSSGWSGAAVRIEASGVVPDVDDPMAMFKKQVNDLMQASEDAQPGRKMSVGLRTVRWSEVDDFPSEWAGSKGHTASYIKPPSMPGDPDAPAGFWHGAGDRKAKVAAWVAKSGTSFASVHTWEFREELFKTRFSAWAGLIPGELQRFAGEWELGDIRDRL